MRCTICNKDRGPEDFSVFHELCKIDPVFTWEGIRSCFVPGCVCDKCRGSKRLETFRQEILGKPFDEEGKGGQE